MMDKLMAWLFDDKYKKQQDKFCLWFLGIATTYFSVHLIMAFLRGWV